jgi:transposase
VGAAIELRDDFTGDDLRRLARAGRDAGQVRRLLALAVILDGGTRTEAARIGGVGLQIVRDWVLRFNAEGPAGLIGRKAPGKAPLTAEIRAALARELWFQDEARIGQKNKLTRRWAKRGTRPRAPHDQRTAWAYIFGAICRAEGKGAGIVMPFCDTPAMQEHLDEISTMVAPDAHAILLLDRAGWHLAGALVVPDNITILPLPPRSPELNPVENVWQFLRDNSLSNRVFKGYDDIVAHCCAAWNDLVDQRWRIRPSESAHGQKGSDQCRLV